MSKKDRIIGLLKEGISFSKIVEIVGCSKGTVSYHKKKLSIGKPYVTRSLDKKIVDSIKKDVLTLSVKEIAEKHSISLTSVYKYTKGIRIPQKDISKEIMDSSDSQSIKVIKEKMTLNGLEVNNGGWQRRIRSYCKTRFKELKKSSCIRCGYTNHVELCHIEPISSFNELATMGEINAKENVIALCRNCHWEFDRGEFNL